MSVLTRIERRSHKGKAFQAGVFIALTIGGITMIYPFMLMVAGATRSPMDSARMGLVPDYMVDSVELSRKFLERKYNHDVGTMNAHRRYRDYSFEQATIPEKVVEQRIDDVRQFVEESDMPDHWWILGGTEIYRRTTAPNKHRLAERLRRWYGGDLAAFSQDVGAVISAWRDVQMRIPDWTSPRFSYDPSPLYDEYFRLLRERPLAERAFVSVSQAFLDNAIHPIYGKTSVEAYNAAHKQPLNRFREFSVSRRLPGADQPKLREEWVAFVRQMLNSSFIRADVADAQYQQFLQSRYRTIDALNRAWPTMDLAAFDQVRLPGDRQWIDSAQRHDYELFLETVDPSRLYLVGPEFAWHDFLNSKYGSIDRLNVAQQSHRGAWNEAVIPVDHVEHGYVLAHRHSLRWQFATANFRDVFDEVVVQGRPFINSMIFVTLSLLFALTVQPLAAYALSRFDPPGTWRIILIFMVTMAFPPMVGLIPQFLILRQFNLLNTFLALILPIIVNGYLIFLLKGFFDSLPHYLYEAALIDGASELRMFWEITMALSKPILAVVALQVFHHAWLAFMYPLLVAPDESMHVLAVWLYQFQQEAPSSAVFASILITSIPTLLIFVVTQRTIMRGIAVPAEK